MSLERINFHDSGLPDGAVAILSQMWRAQNELAESNKQLADNNMRISQIHAEHLNKVTLQSALANNAIDDMRKEQRAVQKFFGVILVAILMALLAVLFHVPFPQISI